MCWCVCVCVCVCVSVCGGVGIYGTVKGLMIAQP